MGANQRHRCGQKKTVMKVTYVCAEADIRSCARLGIKENSLFSFVFHCLLPEVSQELDTVIFANEIKRAVDDTDEEVRMYSTKQKCHR